MTYSTVLSALAGGALIGLAGHLRGSLILSAGRPFCPSFVSPKKPALRTYQCGGQRSVIRSAWVMQIINSFSNSIQK
jgi:hypothetical protein